jgi:hypothetical protein
MWVQLDVSQEGEYPLCADCRSPPVLKRKSRSGRSHSMLFDMLYVLFKDEIDRMWDNFDH